MTSLLPTPTRAVVWGNVPVHRDERVAFIRIDDGYAEDPDAPLIVETGLPVNTFINYYAVAPHGYPPVAADAAHIAYVRRFTTPARGVGNHCKSHVHLAGMNYADQFSQINNGANFLSNVNAFGVRPTLFAPPYGEFDNNTLLAARASGFGVLMGWTHTPSDLLVGKPLRPGDVILLHFTTTLATDLILAMEALDAAELTPALLEDYIL